MASTTTVRVREETGRRLAEMAKSRGKTIPAVIAELVDSAQADEILTAHTRAVSASGACDEYAHEIASLEGTMGDGLEGDPWPVDEHGDPQR